MEIYIRQRRLKHTENIGQQSEMWIFPFMCVCNTIREIRWITTSIFPPFFSLSVKRQAVQNNTKNATDIQLKANQFSFVENLN